MKKCIMLLCVAAAFFFAGIQESLAIQKPPVDVSPVQPNPPDLSVSVSFPNVISYKNTDGIQCYSPRPYFTITNRGQSAANNFEYIIEWKLGPGHTWQIYTSNPNISLGPGKTKTIDGNQPTWDQPWCVNQPDWKPGWRITVDTKNAVTESNENNNVAEKIFQPFLMPTAEPPTEINRKITPAPIQKRAPMQIK